MVISRRVKDEEFKKGNIVMERELRGTFHNQSPASGQVVGIQGEIVWQDILATG
jgi:hypothetical protein